MQPGPGGFDTYDPNAGEFKVVVPDPDKAQEDGNGNLILAQLSGTFFLTPGEKTILFKHFEIIADQHPELINGEIDYDNPESVHLLQMGLFRVDVEYDVSISKRVNISEVVAGDTNKHTDGPPTQ